MQHHRTTLLLRGMRDTLPLILAAIPFGILFGAAAISQGLSVFTTMAMSLFVYAGASQFIAVTLLASSTALPVILMTVFIVNLRHMLYSAALMPQVSKLKQWMRIPLAFWLTDETFAVVSHRDMAQPDAPGWATYYLGSALAMYGNWIFCTWVGMTIGQQIPDMTTWGLDIALIVAFVAIVVPALRKRADWACALTAAVVAVLCFDWPNQTGLLFAALSAIGVGLLLDRTTTSDAGQQHV